MFSRSALPSAIGTLCLALAACQNTAAQAPEGRVFEVVALEFAEAGPMTDSLSGLFAGSTVRVHADPRTNSLLIAAAPDEMDRAKAIVSQLDVEIAPHDAQASSVEVIVLENALASDVQSSLRGLVETRASKIAVDPRMNALLVSASPASLARIKDLIVQLDQPQ